MAAATHMLKTPVTHEAKQIVESVARRQQLTESAWLRRLVMTTLQTTGATAEPVPERPDEPPRAGRLMIRLTGSDRLLLQARAAVGLLSSFNRWHGSLASRGTSHLCPFFVPSATHKLPGIRRTPAEMPRMENTGKIGISSEKLRASMDRRVSVAPMMDWTD